MGRNYDRDKVLRDLKNKGIRVKYTKNKKPIHLTAKPNLPIGIKTWGKIDFLKMNLVRKQ